MNTTIESKSNPSETVRSRSGRLGPSNFRVRLPAHKLYVETRGSLDAWLFQKPRSPTEVLNDNDGEAFNFSRSLVNEEKRATLADAFASKAMPNEADGDLQRAYRFAVSIEGVSKSFRSAPVKKRTQIPLMSGLSGIDSAFDRLRGVQLERASLIQMFKRFDCPAALFLCDERNVDEQLDSPESRMKAIDSAKGKVILLVRGTHPWPAASTRWRKHSLVEADTLADDGEASVESVWSNY